MFCKNCGAQLEEQTKVCPACGAKTESNDKVMKIVVAVACLLILAAVLVVVVLKSLDSGIFDKEEETPTEATQSQEVETTAPAVDYPSYTVDDATIAANLDAVVATVGDYKLTVSQLQMYYWFQVYMYQEKYADYINAGYLALNVTKPLSEQSCAEDPTVSWEQFFVKKAIATWQSYALMNMMADQEGFQMDPSVMEDLKASHQADATAAGFDSLDSYFADMLKDVGNNATAEDYWEYMEFSNRATIYFAQWYDSITPTMDEMEAYYAENEKTFVDGGAGKDAGYSTVDIRHILIMVGEDTDAGWKLAETEAQRILQEYKDGGATEELFAQLAEKYSVDSASNTNGGLYSGVTSGQMVEVFNDWIMDPNRKPGDTDILKADYHYQGYHIMYYVNGHDPLWEAAVKQTMIAERSSEMVTSGKEKWPMEKVEENIMLGVPEFDV